MKQYTSSMVTKKLPVDIRKYVIGANIGTQTNAQG